MKKTLETILNIICNLFIVIIMWFWFYFLVMLKLVKIDPSSLWNYFWWNEADVALWNIRNVLSTKFVIILHAKYDDESIKIWDCILHVIYDAKGVTLIIAVGSSIARTYG